MSFQETYFLVGGAGFIGSHFTDFLMSRPETKALTIYDNFSSGRDWHVSHHAKDPRFKIVKGDVNQIERMTTAMHGHDVVMHFASNPDIAAAAKDPDIDFREGTVLTRNICEAMRISGAKRILYCSGSGVYGDLGDVDLKEDYGPMVPISTYGASKLAGEALIASYCFMFDKTACAFRFANVVGPRQTHGVGFDFARRLRKDPSVLTILGDGSQSKSYVYVEDIVAAVTTANWNTKTRFEAFNVGTGDYITVKEIAHIALKAVGLSPETTRLEFGGGNRGWKGDVPVIRLNSDKIRKLGWKNKKTAAQAMLAAIEAMLPEIESGRLT